jgi:hypothetical protein
MTYGLSARSQVVSVEIVPLTKVSAEEIPVNADKIDKNSINKNGFLLIKVLINIHFSPLTLFYYATYQSTHQDIKYLIRLSQN